MQTPSAHALPPRRVPAAHGWQWLRQAFFLVREQPLTWLLFAVFYLLLQTLLGSLGSLGQLLGMVSVPVFAGGFVMAAARADRGETLRPLDVFAACQHHFRQLLGLGLAYFGLLCHAAGQADRGLGPAGSRHVHCLAAVLVCASSGGAGQL